MLSNLPIEIADMIVASAVVATATVPASHVTLPAIPAAVLDLVSVLPAYASPLARVVAMDALPHTTADAALASGRIDLLERRYRLGLSLLVSARGLEAASHAGHLTALRWLSDRGHLSNSMVLHTARVLEAASRGNQVAVLAWWAAASPVPRHWPFACIQVAAKAGATDALRWWYARPTMPGMFTRVILREILRERHLDATEWWISATGMGGDVSTWDADLRAMLVATWPLGRTRRAFATGALLGLHWTHAKVYCELSRSERTDALDFWTRQFQVIPNDLIAIGTDVMYAPIHAAARAGSVKALQWWRTAGCAHPAAFSRVAQLAAINGHVQILDWVRESCLPLIMDENTLDTVSINGHATVLAWLEDHDLASKLPYSSLAFSQSASRGHLQVLQWWKQSGRLPKCKSAAVDLASANGHVRVLQWVHAESGWRFEATPRAIDGAAANGRLEVLQWWRDQNATGEMPVRLTALALDSASGAGNLAVLEWWKRAGWPLAHTERAVDAAMTNGHTSVLDFWWRQQGEFWYSLAGVRGHLARTAIPVPPPTPPLPQQAQVPPVDPRETPGGAAGPTEPIVPLARGAQWFKAHGISIHDDDHDHDNENVDGPALPSRPRPVPPRDISVMLDHQHLGSWRWW
ncbi:hypothetical protein BC828DRAFT_379141 [Blastocladiella britannica]|nr:hypothetical protein BC828DRAFT_379141 [Blastocladiella britannica]